MKKITTIIILILNFITSNAQTQEDIKLLTQFGINPQDSNSDIIHSIENITYDLRKLVQIGAKSLVFKKWNDMLLYYKANDYDKFVLVPLQGTSLEPPTNRGELSQYRIINGRNYGLMYDGKDVIIYIPATASPQVSEGDKKEFDPIRCRKCLVEYFSAAIRFETDQDPNANPTINNSDNRTFIKGCYGANIFENLEITSNDLPIVSKEFRIYKWIKKNLTIEDISYLLSGKDKSLPSGKNPYLPFPIMKKHK